MPSSDTACCFDSRGFARRPSEPGLCLKSWVQAIFEDSVRAVACPGSIRSGAHEASGLVESNLVYKVANYSSAFCVGRLGRL